MKKTKILLKIICVFVIILNMVMGIASVQDYIYPFWLVISFFAWTGFLRLQKIDILSTNTD